MHVCTRVRIILVLVCGIMYHIRTYLVSRISSAPKIRIYTIYRYVCTRATSPPQKKEQKAQHRLRERHTHSATVIAQQGACNNYGQRYRGCSCCLMDIESLMIRRPFGSIDPNSIRETELHTKCRRRREREACHYAAAVAEKKKILENNTKKLSTEKQSSAIIVHEPKRTATS